MAVYVTKYLSAIWHAILDNFRPITIWGLDLLIFYVLLPNSGNFTTQKKIYELECFSFARIRGVVDGSQLASAERLIGIVGS